MVSNMMINWSVSKKDRFCATFLNAFMEYYKKMAGGSKQEMMSRFMVIGMMNDPTVRDLFNGFRENYFKEEHEHGEEDRVYLDHVMSIMGPQK